MTAYSTSPDEQKDRFGSGLTGAILLHIAIAAAIFGFAFLERELNPHLGEDTSTAGAIQASMVSAIPLPSRVPPVKDSVLAPDDVSKAAAPPEKVTALPPPKPTDVQIKANNPPKTTKVAPVPTTAPKHPQPTPPTPKATTGQQATQLPEATVQTVNGTATVTVQNRTLGERYAWYIRLISNKVQQYYSQEYPDPRSSAGKSVTITFYVDTSGSPTSIQIQTPSGSPTLDNAGKRAVEEVETFGPNPANQQIPIAFTFNYKR